MLSGALTQVQQEPMHRKVPLGTYLLGQDFDIERNIQSSSKWVDLLGLERGRVVVVRPNQHNLDLKHSADSRKNCVLSHLGL